MIDGTIDICRAFHLPGESLRHIVSGCSHVAKGEYLHRHGLASNKVMLSVWWDWKEIVHYELSPPGKTIDSDLYCQQLMKLKKLWRKTGRIR